jgi:asparagine synthase (glutamine-hydrolysing)
MTAELRWFEEIVKKAPYLHVSNGQAQHTTFTRGTEPTDEEGPDGLCVHWSWDGETATVRNDRYGFSPIFYYASETDFLVSDSIPKLLSLGAPADPNDPALNVFLHIGWFLAEDTPFKHIRSLPANATLSWSKGKLDLKSTPYPYKPLDISRDDAIDGYIELFRQAIARRLPKTDTFGLPISGGRDSRHILLELIRQGHKPTDVVTTEFYPPRRNSDSMPSRALADFCGVRHTLLRQIPRYEAEAETVLRTSFCCDEHSWMMNVCHFMGERLGTTYDGIIGDVLTQSPFLRWDWLAEHKEQRWERLLDNMLDYYQRLGGYVVMLNPEVRKRFPTEQAREMLKAEMQKYIGHDDPNDKFVCWSRSKREVSHMPFSMFAAYTHVETPYLDKDLFDFLYNLPVARWYTEGGNKNCFHTDVIAHAYPEAANVPYSDDNWTKRRIVSRHHWLYAAAMASYLRRTPHGFLDQGRVRRMLHESFWTGTRIISHYGPMMQYLTHLNQFSGGKVFGGPG